jgi:hypothetical protein
VRRYHDAGDENFAEKLEQYGEADMARLLREDPEEFRRRSEADSSTTSHAARARRFRPGWTSWSRPWPTA